MLGNPEPDRTSLKKKNPSPGNGLLTKGVSFKQLQACGQGITVILSLSLSLVASHSFPRPCSSSPDRSSGSYWMQISFGCMIIERAYRTQRRERKMMPTMRRRRVLTPQMTDSKRRVGTAQRPGERRRKQRTETETAMTFTISINKHSLCLSVSLPDSPFTASSCVSESSLSRSRSMSRCGQDNINGQPLQQTDPHPVSVSVESSPSA
jgi:hypothetical protein